MEMEMDHGRLWLHARVLILRMMDGVAEAAVLQIQ